MTPTAELRFVERQEQVFAGTMIEPDGERTLYTTKNIRILQQRWEKKYQCLLIPTKSEWRDVPCVKEEA